MSLYRCAACGSQNVVIDTRYDGVGYDYLKGAVGTVVLGAGGAAAGIKSKNVQVYKCAECGIELTYAMPEEIKLAIDIGVMNEEARANLKFANGIPMDWDNLKKSFKNIERGPADEAIEQHKQYEQEKNTGLMSYGTASEEEFNAAIDVVADYIKKFCPRYSTLSSDDLSTLKRPMTFSEYMMLHAALEIVIENSVKYIGTDLKITESASFHWYRGLWIRDIPKLFYFYLNEKMRIRYGTCIYYCFDERYAQYMQENPFVKWYVDYIEIPYGPKEGIGFARDGVFMDNIFFSDWPGDKKIDFSFSLPHYIVENGRVKYHCLSIDDGMNDDYDRDLAQYLKQDYFSVFPEKRQIYTEKLAEIQGKLKMLEELNEEIESLIEWEKRQKSTIQSLIKEAEALKGKIFGKSKALSRAAELEAEVQKIREQIEENDYKKYELKYRAESIDATLLYKDLLMEMDYFVVWRTAEEE